MNSTKAILDGFMRNKPMSATQGYIAGTADVFMSLGAIRASSEQVDALLKSLKACPKAAQELREIYEEAAQQGLQMQAWPSFPAPSRGFHGFPAREGGPSFLSQSSLNEEGGDGQMKKPVKKGSKKGGCK